MGMQIEIKKISGSYYLLLPSDFKKMAGVVDNELFDLTVMGNTFTYTKTGIIKEKKPMPMADDKEFIEKLEKETGVPKGTYQKGDSK